MSQIADLDEAYALLTCNRVLDRKKALERIREMLVDHKIVKSITKEDPFSWNMLLESTQSCLRKECEKFVEECAKKGTKTPHKNVDLCKDLFLCVVNTAISEGEEMINISKLIRYIDGCLKETKMKACRSDFLLIIKDSILPNQNCLGLLSKEDFELLFDLVKSSLESTNLDSPVALVLYRSFLLLFKHGPLAAFSSSFLREQFSFVSKLCQKVSQSSSRNIQEDVMALVLEFCKHTVEDNRTSCVKLGEEVFSCLIDLYSSGHDSLLKVNFIEFCLLQMTIHTPNGVTEHHPHACAYHWHTWKKCIRNIYTLLSNEISQYLRSGVKNTMFFIPQENGKYTVILDSFVNLFVEVSNQMFSDKDFLNCTTSFSSDGIASQSQKRRKVEANIDSYFTEIRETKCWVWIKLVSALLRTYPTLLDERSYLNLLQTLQTSQLDENNSMNYIYECQTVLLEIQGKITITNYKTEIQNLWKMVGEATVRAVGLNHNIKFAQQLLQKLIVNNVVELDSVLQTYNSNIVFNNHSVKTLETVMRHVNYSQFDATKKRELFSCLVNLQGFTEYKHFLEPNFSKIVVTLMLRQCVIPNNNLTAVESDQYKELIELYAKSNFDLDNVTIGKSPEKNESHTQRTYNVDTEVCDNFLQEVRNFAQLSTKETLEKRLSVLCFLYNLLSDLIIYGIINLDKVPENELFTFIKSEFNDETVIQKLKTYKTRDEMKLKQLLGVVDVLDAIFSIKNAVTDIVKHVIPMGFLTMIFEIFNHLEEDSKKRSGLEHQVKKNLIESMSKYCFISNSNNRAEPQYLLMSVLAKPDYNYNIISDYNLSLTFLRHIKLANQGFIPDDVMSSILDCIKKISEAKFRTHNGALDILSILKDIYFHAWYIQDADLREVSVRMLNIFYTRLDWYSPDVSVAVLDCVQTLSQVDRASQFSQWNGEDIMKKVPEFLSSDFQRVRFRAIDILVDFFTYTSKSRSLKDFHRQEEIFVKIYEQSIQVFEVEGNLTAERRRDEIFFRTASVLQTFLTLMVTCSSWLEESLLALIKLEYHKKLGLVNPIYPILRKLFKNEKECMKKYLEAIIEKWMNGDYSIDDFQFQFFNCTDKSDMYMKYFDTCLPLLLRHDRNGLFKAAKQLNMTETQVFEKSCTKIFGRSLAKDIEYVGEDFLKKSVEVSYLNQVLKDRLFEILKENVDQLIISLLNSVTDERLIYERLGENVIFTSKGLSYTQFLKSLKYIEGILFNGRSVVYFLSNHNVYKIQKILLNLQINIYNSLSDEQVKSFHRYTIFVDLIMKNLSESSSVITYFLRDTLYFNVNFMKNNLQNDKITLAAAKYFNSFLKKLVPNFARHLKDFLIFTVNSLKNFAISTQSISKICINSLEYLLVDNAVTLVSAIEKMDAFPQTKEFEKIKTVHNQIKYNNKQVTLEDEIKCFLAYKDIATRQDSLVHLRNILSKEKSQLKSLFDNLEHIRGFSEDCEASLLHQLLSMLIKMSCFPNPELNFEAIRCLGELGPANLSTLVLKPEDRVSVLGQNANVIFTGAVISLLSQYIVDPDITVVKNSSDALYDVLQYKDGKKIIEADIDFGFGKIKREYILPFIKMEPSSPGKLKIDLEKFSLTVNNPDIWSPRTVASSNHWVTVLVSTILSTFDEGCFLPKLIPVCQVKPKFCELILPLLIHVLLQMNNNRVNDLLSIQINEFFERHWQMTVKAKTEHDSISVDKKAVKCMLDVINFVRQQYSASKNLGRLELNYLLISKAAAFCLAHFTALMYAELWCRERISDIEKKNKNGIPALEDGYTLLDVIYENTSEEDISITLQGILRGAYEAIGDTEALFGCGITLLQRPEFRVEHQKKLGQWDQVMRHYSMETMHQPSSSLYESFVESLKKNGLYQLPLLCGDILTEPQYECLWRLGQWNTGKNDKIRPTEKQRIDPSQYEKYKFESLKALRDKDEYSFVVSKKKLSLTIIENLKHISLEGSKNLYPILTQLQSLVEIEDFYKSIESQNFESLMKKWMLQDELIRKNDFQYVEPIAAQRWTIFSEFCRDGNVLKNHFIQSSLSFADYAKSEGHVSVAAIVMNKLQKISDLSEDIKNEIHFREAQIAWLNDDKVIAKHVLRTLLKNDNISIRLKANALKLQGDYLIETYAERTSILNSYFTSFEYVTSIRDDMSLEDHENVQDTFHKLATFADKEYQQIMAHIKSDIFQRKIRNVSESREMAKTMGSSKNMTNDEKRAQNFHIKFSNLDEAEIKNTYAEKDMTLVLAVKYYLKALIMSECNNTKIFRLMSLFLENRDNNKCNEAIKKYIDNMSSYKYITMLPQLVPHICDQPSDLFGKKINEIIEKCAREHPHHTLPLLLALANANKDKDYTKSVRKCLANERTITSEHVLRKLKKNAKLADIITKMQLVSEALIELAYHQAESSGRKNEFDMNKKLKIHKVNNFDNVLVPTYTLPVSKTNSYENIVGIAKFEPTYVMVGGINAPKKITCKTTTGKNHLQLVKGQDDLRQDAVMEQVFSIMNDLLSSNKQSKNLLIRTYKIVPLSMRSGILKWVDNSMPIGMFLTGENGNGGAHTQFRPHDMSATDCRNMFRKCQTNDQKLKTFKDIICKKFKPVMHKFFESYFPQPTVWYERRRAYIHSVATTSMCGYILGIGDRHVSNILIDKLTAEVIHIDFGISFDQGKCLPTPETVPFRLSRDIVDGMGVSGIEGLFRSACERTMEVLRNNSQTILTILEVLLYDPLYYWTVTPAEANKRQTGEDFVGREDDPEEENKNVSAERALLRLRSKLQGTEEGKPTSVEQQVGALIQQAIDPVNLSKLFHGWQPWL